MFRRIINPLRTNSFFLFGARATGKSTYIQAQFRPEKALCFDLLDPEQEDRYTKNPKLVEQLIETQKPEWVVIDEVQRIPKLLNIAHRLIERDKQKFILLGSSARKLKRGLGNLLAGRAFVHELFPLTTHELGHEFDLKEVMQWGSLPHIFSFASELERKRFLRSYVQTYLREEIQQEQIVRRLDPFRLFLDIAAQNSGKIINAHRIGSEAGCDGKTVLNYFQILEATYVGFFLPAFHLSIRKSQRQKPKFYFFDIGIKRTLDQTLGDNITPKTSSYGELFEHWVVQEIYRLNSYTEHDYRLSYFQTPKGAEIDLILTRSKQHYLIEIKSTDAIDEIEVRSLGRFAADFGGSATAVYLSQSSIRVDIEGVQCWNWKDWLRTFFV
ncbi:MAG: ATP-binding protein [SAR324 cluster bacterium]|uniref:ATP-binding protein n=1 Tax=SAR324 cluster bacterium TaxID=2024889 RepID=A0A7X9FTS4_9DELT|nr:ATP-binding protein [SAR324 cluster bacterium]